MLIRAFAGGPARSAFRLQAWRRLFADAGIRAEPESRRVYLVQAHAWGDADTALLAALAGEPLEPLTALAADEVLLTPRLGTISPWSSKATEIARIAGLENLERIEHAELLRVAGAGRNGALAAARLVMDRMTQSALAGLDEAARLFTEGAPRPLARFALGGDPQAVLARLNRELGLALSGAELAHLADLYAALGRDPTDAELVMFAQVNSEHCRHKIFRAPWRVDGRDLDRSLFDRIRDTYRAHPGRVLVAYRDNAAVIEGFAVPELAPDADGVWRARTRRIHLTAKVETHNHPTAISPYPGAATGAGGEIRDEAATGRGGASWAGLAGFATSHLRVPGWEQPWEARDFGRPDRIASPLAIMLEGPIGAARFHNEFGRPALAGFFRTLEIEHGGHRYGYHKPVMLAGGMGALYAEHADKGRPRAGDFIVQLGGPGMRIGLGGGAASSMSVGESSEELEFASVQRDNPEMQRRCQEVLDACRRMGDDNPILFIHDVGAGGLANAVPELAHDAGLGARVDLAAVPTQEPDMSPMEVWCNEAQERYVLAVRPGDWPRLAAICARERCPVAKIGELTKEPRLVVEDTRTGERAVDMPLAGLFEDLPIPRRTARLPEAGARPAALPGVPLEEAARRVLRFPAVAAKTFLITIGDRSVGGRVVRDQLVGRWQVPTADCAVLAAGDDGREGGAFAIGERPAVALSSPAASARLAIAEAITNLLAADVETPADVALSANWMAACGDPDEDGALLAAVEAAGRFAQALGVSIPVGKDSLSMRTVWEEDGARKEVRAPTTLVVSAFARVADVRATLTPEIRPEGELWLVDLGRGRNRIGGSVLAQVLDLPPAEAPDADADDLARLWRAVRRLRAEGLLLAWHDRSDGGLFVTLAEMAFSARQGLAVRLQAEDEQALLRELFAEEAGVVFQAPAAAHARVAAILAGEGLADAARVVAEPIGRPELVVEWNGRAHWQADLFALLREWHALSHHMQALRDDPECAREALEAACDPDDPGLRAELSFDPDRPVRLATGARPRVAVLREQGVNGHREMAAAFAKAGFEPVDVHMTDLLEGRTELAGFHGLAACGGFSYGDVFGAGRGWAASVRFHPRLREAFAAFLARPDTFALGVCNGCQMLAALKDLIPGAAHWPRFVRNRSEQFEARLVMVEITPSPSVLLRGMEGSRLPVIVAHGEGRAAFEGDPAQAGGCLRYIGPDDRPARRYPHNPNGSPGGWTGFTNADGRVTIMMPHPERLFRPELFSWRPASWRRSPWLRMFENARAWLEEAAGAAR